MPTQKQKNQVTFDQLVSEQLSPKQIDSSDQIELQVQTIPRFIVMINRGYIIMNINLKLPVKKFLAWLGVVSTFLAGAIKVVIDNWSRVQLLFGK